MNTNSRIWPQWRYLLTHASGLYWLVQALFLVAAVASSMMFWLPGISDSSNDGNVLPWLTRTVVDSTLFVGAAHVFLRPALQIWFVHQRHRWSHWLILIGFLVLLSYLMVELTWWISKHVLQDGLDVSTVRLSSADSEFALDLSGMAGFALGVSNFFITYVVWILLYLAYKALQSRRQLQQQLREARLRQLTHQLSPHFLFNAFNTIRGMIFENQERAAQLVTQLSELFRFHLSHDLRTEQTLSEDWELAQRYLDLESVRLESRLRLDVDLDPECLKLPLPSLTLLTLVENAIKHGIAPNLEGGHLRIRARRGIRSWILEVANSTGHGQAEHSSGTGLTNLRERIELTLGNKARLDIRDGRDEFALRLELPA